LLISDGFGPASETYARQYSQYLHSYDPSHQLPLDTILVGSSRTQSSSSFITDSAAGATAFSCGLKTYNGAIGVDPQRKPCGTLLEAAKASGYLTGLVATSRITHATPASFAAHVPLRDMENQIALHEIGNYSLGRQVDLMFGGGICHFLPRNNSLASCRQDDVNPFELAKTLGWNIGISKEYFDSLKEDASLPILNLFANDHMNYDIDRDSKVQPEMASKALQILKYSTKDSPAGFFVMIEGSRIDMAAHSNDPTAHVHDILAYHETISVVKKFVNENPGTVMISVSDHETGGSFFRIILGFSVGHQLGLTYPEYRWDPGVIAAVKHSSEYIASAIKAQPSEVKVNFVKDTVMKDWLNISDYSNSDISLLTNESISSTDLEYYIGHMVSDRAGLGWSTHGHSAVDVNLYAYGYGASNLAGNHENTDIGLFIARQLGLELDKITRKLGA